MATPTRYDLGLDSTGDLMPTNMRLITGAELVAQSVGIGLKLWAGEYLMDASQGLDYTAFFETKPFPRAAFIASVRATLLAIEGVVAITDFQLDGPGDDQRVTVQIDLEIDVEGESLRVTSPEGISGNAWPQWNILIFPTC